MPNLIGIMCFFLLAQSASADLLPSRAPSPIYNPTTKEKVILGRKLFFDKRLSKTKKVSCFSCHNIYAGGEDNRAHAVLPNGKLSARSVPTVLNSGFLSTYFWFGQANTLEEQAEGPLEEMGLGDLNVVVENVKKITAYQGEFKKVFKEQDSINLKNITYALAAFERTLNTPRSYDLFLKGKRDAMSDQAKEGMRLFKKVGCVQCHSGPIFAGPVLPSGQGWFKKFPIYPDNELERRFHFSDELGRFKVTQKEEDKHVFRVPTLRNIALTAPYFHNGSVKTLDEAVRVMAKTQLNRELSDNSVNALVEFLKALSE